MPDMQLYLQRNRSDVKESASLRILAARLGLKLNFKDSTPNWIKWALAAEGSFMLNTYGSVQETGNGFRGIIRDSLGNVTLAYAGSSQKASVLYQELLAIAKGIQTCSTKNGKLVGKLSPLIGKLTKLRVLSMPFNDFDGEIPVEI
ncbi:hypothetical protein IFM89_014434 [Coptis chinensis]|uniref:RNase H type-1 domain-containing protein n=1 Tax=Coptis chinensis TaxID=261450 RepID=A0A835I028_9MAGN|nr:hypothetical protein IFM89_014434 [Coptis chinensis]